MPKWCMSCGNVKMPETNTSVKKTLKGVKWITPSRAALKRKKIVVCGDCWKRITWEA